MQVLFTLWLALLPFLQPTPTVSAAAPSPCRIYGSVYLERDPMYKSMASHIVFVGEEEAFADMVVFRESNKLFADAPAIWYITPNKAFADHILYVTDQRHLADFTVHFTDVRAIATCRD
ncbi:DUF6150 family protein [Pontibacter akesuensis]|uniref:7(1) septoil knot domain-containing protein n=2 Tax=Pontibacter akesuensis TaxID=388950 RepID=A0A1I7ILW9_9BACT|nr:DUF6150 family protein [Pontibacter akesuensis]GHA67794.1 hypothetical protein GCM10007389_21380 [Pontibacter akesuensis]SFU73941.1 hypothetical protein SAMN04487941_2310 [Pontibacter akesuensis]